MTAVRSDDLRSQNRRRVLAAIRRHEGASRTEIATSTELSPATVSAITSDFIDEGVLKNRGTNSGTAQGRGRPQMSLTVNPNAALSCAVHFELNRLTAVIVDYSGAAVGDYVLEVATQQLNAVEIKQQIIFCIESALKKPSQKNPALGHIAVGFQGVIDVEGTKVLWSPICEQRNIPIQRWLEEYFGTPTRVFNDCDLIAQALNRRDPDKYANHFGTVLLDRGVGMGLYLRNCIINGTRSSGVEFGHMIYQPGGACCRCGNSGCIEAYAGDYAISRRAQGKPGTTPPSVQLDSPDLDAVLRAAIDGEPDAIAAIQEAGAAIGTGLASMFALVDQFPIVIVGRGAALFELMESSLRKSLSSAPRHSEQSPVDIDCFVQVSPLVQEGAAIVALQAQDETFSNRRLPTEAEAQT
ncbi:MAG: ROK family transcriptional regulator [Gammaproteobacteria bacterium]|nr:ROK family transcriptional regulator [Gammaproteobacteria bacterium]